MHNLTIRKPRHLFFFSPSFSGTKQKFVRKKERKKGGKKRERRKNERTWPPERAEAIERAMLGFSATCKMSNRK